MKKLTFKSFIREWFINIIIFLGLMFIYTIMLAYPDLSRLAPMWGDVLIVFPALIIWVTYVVFFYFLFFRLINDKKISRAWRNLVILTLGIFVTDQIYNVIDYYFNPVFGGHLMYELSLFITGIFRLILFSAYAVAYSFIRGYIWQRQQKLIIEKENAKAGLQNLRSQIEPHFIFNTLNNIYALALEEKAGKTSKTIEELSGLFRYTLKESDKEHVPVEDELEFIEKYIQLNKIRLEQNSHTRIETNIAWDKKPAKIAPLLLISFVENAFKYGISMQERSFISINVEVKDALLIMTAENSIQPKSNAVQNGFGLTNTKKRLDLLYQNKHTLQELHDDKKHSVQLEINLA